MAFETQRKFLIDEISKYLKIDRNELRVFGIDTLNSMLKDLKLKRNIQ